MDGIFRAVASPRRREILRLLMGRERRAGELHRALGDVTFGAVSQHLRLLADVGLVRVRREGRSRIYSVTPGTLGGMRGPLERMWEDALYRLRLRAEMEQARRGPRPRAAGSRPRRPEPRPRRRGPMNPR